MKQEIRKYNMSDTELLILAGKLKLSALRDFSELEKNGVDSNTLNKFQNAIYDFSSKPTDEELSEQINVSNFVHRPHQQEKALHDYSILNKFSFDNFPYESIDAMKYHTPLKELTFDGITEEMIERLKVRNCANSYAEVLKERNFAVYDRIAAGNTLFQMISSIAAKGQERFHEICEKRLNDYTTAEKYINNWQCTDGDIAPNSVVTISASPITETTVFTLSNNSSKSLNFFFTNSPSQISSAHQVKISPGRSQTYTSLALGFDENTGRTFLNVYNDHALPGKYLIEWI